MNEDCTVSKYEGVFEDTILSTKKLTDGIDYTLTEITSILDSLSRTLYKQSNTRMDVGYITDMETRKTISVYITADTAPLIRFNIELTYGDTGSLISHCINNYTPDQINEEQITLTGSTIGSLVDTIKRFLELPINSFTIGKYIGD